MAEQKRVFIADKLSADALEVLKDVPITVDNRPGLPLEEKHAALKEANALIVRSATKVTKDLL